MAETKIQWTDHSINPIRFDKGHFCQMISPGCAHCYASRLQPRFGNPEFGGVSGRVPHLACRCGADRTGPSAEAHKPDCPAAKPQTQYGHQSLWLDEAKLQEVLRRKKPTKYFWCDMTDMFGSWVPDEWLDACFAVMALTRQHTHQVLTKRPERMRDYMISRSKSARFWKDAARRLGYALEFESPLDGQTYSLVPFPLPNVWLGVSVEDQQRADERIPLLLQTPVAVRFLSVEPLLGPVDLINPETCWLLDDYTKPRIHWVIIGGESGRDARPCNVAWIRSLVAQCRAAGVAPFVKQLGSVPVMDEAEWRAEPRTRILLARNHHKTPPGMVPLLLLDSKGGDPDEWSPDLRVREFPAMERMEAAK